MHYYNICLDVRDKLCLVVGGGLVAEGKVAYLLDCGAKVRVISPDLTPELAARANRGEFEWWAREYREGDIDERHWLVIAATDDRAANARVAAAARAHRVLVNAVDDVPNCDFVATSIVRRGDIQLGISTAGRSPAFARWLRLKLEETIDADYAAMLDVCGDVRDEVRREGRHVPVEAWHAAVTDDLLETIRRHGPDVARERLRAALVEEARVK